MSVSLSVSVYVSILPRVCPQEVDNSCCDGAPLDLVAGAGEAVCVGSNDEEELHCCAVVLLCGKEGAEDLVARRELA